MTVETIEHDGARFVVLNPEHVKQSAMTSVQKVKHVYAVQVPEGEEYAVTTMAHGQVEATNIARAGDWVVYNIGTSDAETIEAQLEQCDKKVISAENFAKLYAPKAEDDSASDQRGTIYEYIGGPIEVAQVPFAFCVKAPWGGMQYMQAGSYITHNKNTGEWYGTAGARNRKAGQLESTYTLVDDDPRTMSKAFRMVIAADRSPIAGIQFNMEDLAQAYDRIGKELGKLEQYL